MIFWWSIGGHCFVVNGGLFTSINLRDVSRALAGNLCVKYGHPKGRK